MANTKFWSVAIALVPMATSAMETQFAGFSGVAVPGHVGLVGMHGACQAAFGDSARMCVTDEVVRAPEIVRFSRDLKAWVQPGGDRFPCAGWASAIGSGAVLDARTMAFGNEPCKSLLFVTCCQKIPVE